VMRTRNCFFLYKGKCAPDSRNPSSLAHGICLRSPGITEVKRGDIVPLHVEIVNKGGARWLHKTPTGIGAVKIGTHIYSMQNKLLELDFSRHEFDRTIEPGERQLKTVELEFPVAGSFIVAIDLVSEGVCWFEHLGSKAQTVTVHVR